MDDDERAVALSVDARLRSSGHPVDGRDADDDDVTYPSITDWTERHPDRDGWYRRGHRHYEGGVHQGRQEQDTAGTQADGGGERGEADRRVRVRSGHRACHEGAPAAGAGDDEVRPRRDIGEDAVGGAVVPRRGHRVALQIPPLRSPGLRAGGGLVRPGLGAVGDRIPPRRRPGEVPEEVRRRPQGGGDGGDKGQRLRRRGVRGRSRGREQDSVAALHTRDRGPCRARRGARGGPGGLPQGDIPRAHDRAGGEEALTTGRGMATRHNCNSLIISICHSLNSVDTRTNPPLGRLGSRGNCAPVSGAGRVAGANRRGRQDGRQRRRKP
ncbi:hypothetical protein THAOC_10040 [Thalassiosira oceanica]|uniref:Uncharacterized protein n=1 Tax=Thalassiosira oceanica TaxID=159749 RepID=K0SUZ5_THAOC|nr:hypothetical protein THAOC_10040 [Thalassiosira oceanica]|eukprot:EJK68754.1 hypothetical protein THAOC_10040 [Thalassiosira oceanica]